MSEIAQRANVSSRNFAHRLEQENRREPSTPLPLSPARAQAREPRLTRPLSAAPALRDDLLHASDEDVLAPESLSPLPDCPFPAKSNKPELRKVYAGGFGENGYPAVAYISG